MFCISSMVCPFAVAATQASEACLSFATVVRQDVLDLAAAGAREIQIDNLVLKEPCPGKTCQRTGVDMGVIDAVMAGDEAGQHA